MSPAAAPPFDVFREITRLMARLAPLQRDPRPGLLDPRGTPRHEVVALDLGPAGRPIPATWLRPRRPTGRTVVYVHGAATADPVPNAPLFDALLDQGTGVVAFDVDGFGANPAPLRLPQAAETVRLAIEAARRLDGVDPERAGVYGLSLGGAFTLHVARDLPWIKALVLFGTPRALTVGDGERLREMAGTFSPMALPIMLGAPTGHVARCFFEPVRFEDGAALTIFDPGFVARVDALARALDPYGAAPTAPPVPTRLLVGEWDALVPPAAVRELAAALPGPAEVVTFPWRNHTTLLYDRAAAASAADWFERHL